MNCNLAPDLFGYIVKHYIQLIYDPRFEYGFEQVFQMEKEVTSIYHEVIKGTSISDVIPKERSLKLVLDHLNPLLAHSNKDVLHKYQNTYFDMCT